MEAAGPDPSELEDTIEEPTRAGEDWPLPEPYRVGGPASSPESIELETTTGSHEQETIAIAAARAPRPRRFPLGGGAGIPLAAALVLLALIVAVPLLASPSDSASEAGETSASPTVAKVGGASPAPAQPSPVPASHRAAKIEVPDVRGASVAAARRTLREAGLKSEMRLVESDRPDRVVLEQDPGAGDRAVRGSAIVLVVSSGPPAVAVPDVVGLRVDEASRLVRREGLRVEMRFVRSSEQAGVVLEQRPAGRSLRRGAVVELRVAKAPEVTTTRMPRLEGLRLDQAKSRLQARGLRWSVRQVPSSRPAGVVIGQSERAGAVVEKRTRVTLEVSSGPQLVAVPDVVGLEVVLARQQLEAAGFVVLVTDTPTTDPAEDGIVLAQSPGGGTRAPKGSEVTLDVGLAG